MKPAYSEPTPSVVAILVNPETRPVRTTPCQLVPADAFRMHDPTFGSETRRIRVASKGVNRISAKNLRSQPSKRAPLDWTDSAIAAPPR